MLPSVYFSDDPDADLAAYSGAYLQQEIVAEGAIRNIPAFGRFLKVAALCNATTVNYTNVSNDAQVPRTTIHEYFEILRDTLILHELPAWKMTVRRKPLASSRSISSMWAWSGVCRGVRFAPARPNPGRPWKRC